MAFGIGKDKKSKKGEAGGVESAPVEPGSVKPAIEEAEIVEEKQWPDLGNNQQGGEPMTEEIAIGEPNGRRVRLAVKDYWVDRATADAFEKVRAKIGPGTSIRTVTDYFFGEPSRIHTELPEPPPIESYSEAEIGVKVKAALLANL